MSISTAFSTASDTEISPLIADIYEAAGALRRCGDRMSMSTGQSQSGWQVLKTVQEGHQTVPLVSRRLGISRQAVQRVARELLADGLVTVEPNPHHKNSPLMVPTDRGIDLLDRLEVLAGSWLREIDETLDAEDIATTRRVLAALVAAS